MIEVNLAVITNDSYAQHAHGTPCIIESIQCSSYDIGDGAITFYRMRFIGGANNPTEYFASFVFPLHRIAWIQRRFAPGHQLPNFNTEERE